MRALVLTRYGGPEAVELRDVPAPVPGPGQCLIDVHAASVNPIDYKIRRGDLKLVRNFPLPIVLGQDVAGRIAAVGPGVTGFAVGDEVFARADKDLLGAFAEQAVVPEAYIAKKPRVLSYDEAAGVPLVSLTAWQALEEQLKLARGQKLLISAGAGGVGMIAIQLAKRLGLHVTTTASGEGIALTKALGADEVVDYRKDDVYAGGARFDGAFDLVGGDELKRAFTAVKPGGTVVSISGLPEPSTAKMMGGGAKLTTLFWLASFGLRRAAAASGVRYIYLFMRPDGVQLKQIGDLFEAGTVKTRVDRVFPLEQGREALAYAERGRAKGKVIIHIR